MERNTATTITQLQPGDRFYKAADKKKTPWTVVPHEPKKTHFRYYKYFAKSDQELHPSPINKSTPIIFLRHQNQ